MLALALAAVLAVTSVPDAPALSACAFYRDIYPSAAEPDGGERACAAALEEACGSGRRLACHGLARVLEAGVEGEPEPARALALYARACAAGVADACEGAAELRDRRGDREAARAALEEGCAIGSGRACARLAAEAASPERARQLAERACDLGAPDGCIALAREAAAARQAELLIRACRLGADAACAASALPEVEGRCAGGDAAACLQAGRVLQEGRALEADGARAAVWYDRGCELGLPEGCVRLGILHRFGAGVRHDEARAVALFERACAAGEEEGCRLRDDPVRLEE
ncbi:MAG TPA: sel1 repeat family protein [Anaeromyxobacter sp.]|nr:sel1 repeat family protein [Anaeromyxobacter sp.]